VTESPVVQFQNVSKIYHRSLWTKHRALDSVSLSIHPGETVAFLGANGAGKTSMIRLALGLASASHGQVHYRGRLVTSRDMMHIGYMPEVNKIAGDLLVSEVVEDQCLLAGLKRQDAHERTEKALANVGLSGHERRHVRDLSKGMARRLAWVLATIHQPTLLFLDEPASGLDPLARHEMLGWIRDEKKRGTTIVISTHELTQVNDLCDRIIVMKKGRVVKDERRPSSLLQGHYLLHLSGVGEGDVTRLIAQGTLPVVERTEYSGYLAKLEFKDYQAAIQWFLLALKQGYVVTQFGPQTTWVRDDILPLYREATES
jgi:ABC-2 type transport system ATP-binding protein